MTDHRLVRAFCSAALITGLALGSGAQAKSGHAPDKAAVSSLRTSRLAAAFQAMLLSQNQCISYAYDKNGNRTTQANSAFTTTHPVWGTSPYLCFSWSAS